MTVDDDFLVFYALYLKFIIKWLMFGIIFVIVMCEIGGVYVMTCCSYIRYLIGNVVPYIDRNAHKDRRITCGKTVYIQYIRYINI